MSKSCKKVREKSKTRAWEKERRNRLNEYFNKLWEVLPIYDLSKPISKPDILIHATSTVKDFDDKLKKILENSGNEKASEAKIKVSFDVIKKLQERVRKLLLRNEQLTNLLRNAGIKVPSECGTVKKFKKRLKLTNAITTEQQANILQKELEKENQDKGSKAKISKSSLKNKKVVTKSKIKKSKRQLFSSRNCLFVVSQPTVPNNSCFIISKATAKVNQTVMTNSLLVKAPIVSSNIKPSVFPSYPHLTGLGPGTLVFADGTMMPVVPNPRTIPVLPTILTNPVSTQLPTLIVVSSKGNTSLTCSNQIADRKTLLKNTSQNLDTLPVLLKNSVLPVLRPRSSITRTTQVNKVPIPALASKYNRYTCVNGKKTHTDDQRKKESDVPVKNSIEKTLAKKRTLEHVEDGAKKLKTSPEEIVRDDGSSSIPVSQNESQSTVGIGMRASATQGKEKHALLNEQKNNEIMENNVLGQGCNETATSDQQDSSSKNKLSEVSKTICEVLESQPSTSCPIDNYPIQSVTENNNRKIIKSHDLTHYNSNTHTEPNLPKNSGSSIPEFKQTKIPLMINQESNEPLSKLLSSSCSINYHLDAYSTVTAHPDITSHSKPIEKNSHLIAKNVPVTVTKHLNVSPLHAASLNDTPINDSLKNNIARTRSLTSNTDSINTINVQQKSYTAASSFHKQAPKPFELTNLPTGVVTQNGNLHDLKSLEMNLPQTELSNDIFASFQVPPGCQNPESTSPTAAFLLAFPLVSSGAKVAEVMGDENSESQAGTPNLLQIGTMDVSKPTQSYSESLTPNLLSFDNFSFFNNKDNSGGFYSNCSVNVATCLPSISSLVTSSTKAITSLVSNTSVQHINCLDSVIKNDPAKSSMDPSTVQFNKGDIASNKPSSNNNQVDNNAKDSKHDKFPYYIGTVGSCQRQAGKEQSVSNQKVHMSTNGLDINNDIFLFKSASNENYVDNNKYSNSSHVPGPLYTPKSSTNVPHYSNYKNCNSSVSNQIVVNKTYPPVYTSASISNTFYNSFGTECDSRNFNTSNCNYTDYNRRSFTNSCYANSQIYQKEKPNHNMNMHLSKAKPTQNKPINNWMTTPSTTTSYKPDYFLPPFTKEPTLSSNLLPNTSFSTLPSNTYFNSSVYNHNDHLNITQDFRKTSEVPFPTYSSYQRAETDENQFSWSPNKMPQFLDTPHAHSFVSSTLPTLVGDLALNNTPIVDQKNLKDRTRDNRRKAGNCENQSGPPNFLSVSQLVEQGQGNVPAKVGARRSSGNRSKTNTPKTKRPSGRSEPNKEVHNYQKNEKSGFNISVATNLFNESKHPPQKPTKNIPSSYSAEALIGNQVPSEPSTKRNNSCQNKAIVPGFFNENIASYLPSVEVSQDNSYIHASQNYQSNSFSQNFTTTFQNNSYGTNNFIPSAGTITSSYIPTNNFLPNTNTQDFFGDNLNLFQNSNAAVSKEKCNFTKNYYNRPLEKEDKGQGYSCKKAKKRPANENVLPSFDMHFFSMPGAINSPILPDDFHTTYLPPTTLYSCKNPLYPKPNSETIPSSLIPPVPAISGNKAAIQHPQMSPSVNSAGTSLTNFNLSTIFPEINKGPVQETFTVNRNKDYNPVAKSFPMSTSLQVPFSNKSSIIF